MQVQYQVLCIPVLVHPHNFQLGIIIIVNEELDKEMDICEEWSRGWKPAVPWDHCAFTHNVTARHEVRFQLGTMSK